MKGVKIGFYSPYYGTCIFPNFDWDKYKEGSAHDDFGNTYWITCADDGTIESCFRIDLKEERNDT